MEQTETRLEHSLTEARTLLSARQFFRRVVWRYPMVFVWAGLATLGSNLLLVAVALYAMQVYDRVIPSQGIATLIVLTIGVFLALVVDLVFKFIRTTIIEIAAKRMDFTLSYGIFDHLLSLRLDQVPQSLGTLSAQLRSYESIRRFQFRGLLFLLVDLPFGLIFLLGIYWIGGMTLAIIPTVFFVLSFFIGVYFFWRITQHAKEAHAAANAKLGRLVETIENVELIKSHHLARPVAKKWQDLNVEAIYTDAKIQHHSDYAQYFNTFIHQSSYVSLVAVGAYLATTTNLITMGALIAVAILGNRVLAPIAQIPGLLVQWANSREAMVALEKVFELECDHHAVARPLLPSRIKGRYDLKEVMFNYPSRKETLSLSHLKINAGERVGVLGAIGAGKSTLLKIMAGLYPAQQGLVTLDGLDILQIDRERLSQYVGYLSQSPMLVSGTLRYNLLFDHDIDEDWLHEVCEKTGLMAVVNSHPQGFDMMISESGSGLSGGQRQLVAMTRLILRKPSVWLMDEPTANLDDQTAHRILDALEAYIEPEHTLVVITHKPALLKRMVDRVVFLTERGVVIDGTKEEVFARLSAQVRPQEQAHPSSQSTAHQ